MGCVAKDQRSRQIRSQARDFLGDHVHNVEMQAFERDYAFGEAVQPVDFVPEESRASFEGFVRPNGKVGTRNFIGVLTSVNCSATVARHIAEAFRGDALADYPNVDGVVALVHGTGCGMVLFNAKTGQVEALLLDNGYLTDLRTAAAGAVAAKWLAREDARRVGVVGAGVQARLQVKALALVRDLAEVRVWARDAEKAANYAAEMTEDLQIPVSVSASIEAAAAESDILVTTTPSKSPLVFASALHSGLHITAMGSDAEYKNELDPPVLADCDLYACDRRSQCEILGELHHALAAGAVSAETVVPELGEIIAGRVPGRSGPDDVTVCDLTGAGVQDTAIATLAFQRSQDKGAGTVFTS